MLRFAFLVMCLVGFQVQAQQPLTVVNLNEETTVTAKTVSVVEKTTYRLVGGDMIFNLPHGSSIRDVHIRSVDDKPHRVVLQGSNLRIDCLAIQGCTLVLDKLQNSQIDGLLVANVEGNGVEIVNETANCRISGTIKRCSGYGVLIANNAVRSIEIHGMPIEECRLGQACVESMSKFGTLHFKGRLNSTEEDGPPFTANWADRKRITVSADIRNMSLNEDKLYLRDKK